jgi:lipopolysaccharide/colanic/teichoic acid biosynthesis glycosyltransferase
MFTFFKRIFDLIIATVITVIISPFLLIISVLLLLFNNGQIFYFQKRIGYNNCEFGIIKFSTMLKNSENMPGGTITLRNDSRVTTIGKILRMTKLNELPQLFNVLLGSMSFVGPRPMVKQGFNLYSVEVQYFLFKSKPGITGISSIIFRDEEKLVTESNMIPLEFYKNHIFPYKGELEKWYYENKNLWVDILILFITAFKIIVPNSKLEFKVFSTLPKSDYFKF